MEQPYVNKKYNLNTSDSLVPNKNNNGNINSSHTTCM